MKIVKKCELFLKRFCPLVVALSLFLITIAQFRPSKPGTAFEKVLRRVLRRRLAVGFEGRKASEKAS